MRLPVVGGEHRRKDLESNDEVLAFDDEGHLAFSPNDRDNPKNWSTGYRWYVTAVGLLMVINCSFASSAPTGALAGIVETFNISLVVANLTTTLFLSGYCFGPLFWAPLSEYFGRRYIFYISFLGYFAFNFLCAWAPNIGSLLVGRFLTGTFASSAMSNAPGILADIWGAAERGNAMALFIMFTFVGPVIGPITSGFIQLTVGWRWTFYELLWFAAGTILLLPTLPETLPSRCLVNKAERLRKDSPDNAHILAPQEAKGESLAAIFKRSLIRPWLILFDPISFCLAIYFALTYALLYMLFTIYPIVFQEKRGWNAGVGELPLLGMAVGAMVGGIVVFLNTHQERKKGLGSGDWAAERRLPLAMIGAVLLPVSMFWLSWSGNYPSVHWIVPTLAGGFVCCAIVFIFVALMNYLTDTYLFVAASAIAINTVVRSAAAAGGPLFTNQMFHALGVGGAGSLLAGVACLLAPIPFLFYRYGEKVRKASKWAPTDMKKPGAQEEKAAEEYSTDKDTAAS